MKCMLMISAMLLSALCGRAYNNEFKLADAKVSSGKLLECDNFPTKLVSERNVYVWLPDGYSDNKKYSVVYMHDGQMLFDASKTWNHQEWGVDETVSSLISSGKINDCIVVGIWNISDKRMDDYFPQKVLKYMDSDDCNEFSNGLKTSDFDADKYLKFIVTELKPYIDSHFSTYQDREHTFLMGSSMGGLISLYGVCEYPNVFGGAACLSMHTLMVTQKLSNERNTKIAAVAFCQYLKENLPKVNSSHIYIDYGDQTLDSRYAPYQQRVDEVLRNAGWKVPYWTTNFYPGMSHCENDWARRLFVPFMFLLGK